jgi:nitrite reductase/ring-hydroxylating ferredoxin subunit
VKHELFPLAEFGRGERRSVTIGKTAILVAHTPEGKIYAIRDRCSHRGAPLSVCPVERKLEADEVGGYEVSDEYIVRCPWHGYEFSLESGRCVADPERERVKSYSVTVEHGMVVLER